MYPKCLVKPFLLFLLLVVLLFVLVFIFCDHFKDKENVIKVEEITELVKNDSPAEVKKAEVDYLIKVVNDFKNAQIISNEFSKKDSIFFNRNTNLNTNDIIETNRDFIKDARLVILSGSACDLGNKEYNEKLIQKRIDKTISLIKSINPNIEVLYINNGQNLDISQIKDKHEAQDKRKQARRVDVYMYK